MRHAPKPATPDSENHRSPEVDARLKPAFPVTKYGCMFQEFKTNDSVVFVKVYNASWNNLITVNYTVCRNPQVSLGIKLKHYLSYSSNGSKLHHGHLHCCSESESCSSVFLAKRCCNNISLACPIHLCTSAFIRFEASSSCIKLFLQPHYQVLSHLCDSVQHGFCRVQRHPYEASTEG